MLAWRSDNIRLNFLLWITKIMSNNVCGYGSLTITRCTISKLVRTSSEIDECKYGADSNYQAFWNLDIKFEYILGKILCLNGWQHTERNVFKKWNNSITTKALGQRGLCPLLSCVQCLVILKNYDDVKALKNMKNTNMLNISIGNGFGQVSPCK